MSSTPSNTESMAGPSTTPSRTSPRGAQRKHVYTDWQKDEKTKTCKCKICNNRVTKFSLKCEKCSHRICSDCSEPDGANSDLHKAMARDYIDHGCWCGFAGKFNPAFKDSMPALQAAAPPKQTSAPAKKTPAPKRKRGKAAPTPESETPSPDAATAATPDIKSESPEDPFKTSTPPANASAYYYIDPPNQTATESPQAAEGAQEQASSPAEDDEAQEPARKKRKAAESNASQSSSTSSLSDPPSSQLSSSDNIVVAAPPPAFSYRSLPPAADQPVSPPRRATRATKATVVEPASSITEPSSSQSSKPTPPKPVLDNHIVIIGAGAIGMFTALKLAQKAAKNDEQQKITVVDINKEPFALASGHSAGFVTVHGMLEDWDPLMNIAMQEWNDLLDDEKLADALEFSKAVYTPTEDEARQPTKKARWFRPSEAEHLTEDRNTKGRISPACLAQWLQGRCHSLGVQFRWDSHPAEIKRDRQGNAVGVVLHTTGKTKPEILTCSDLLLATGAFTPSLFARLFPKASEGTKPSSPASAAQWVRFSGVDLPTTKATTQGILIPTTTGPISLLAKPSESTLIISGPCGGLDFPRRLHLADALESANPLPSPKALLKLTSEHVEVKGEVDFAAQGKAEASWVCERPVVGRVGEEGAAGVRVWAACGFGLAGGTMAPAVARVVAEMVRGEGCEVDVGRFGVGKGKGKARA